VSQGLIPPLDTRLAGQLWLGAVSEVVVQWLMTPDAPPLESYYPALRRLLWSGLGVGTVNEPTDPARSAARSPSTPVARSGARSGGPRGGRK
jgi:hypothetical protein